MSAHPAAGHDADQRCVCVADHNPNPMELNRHHVWPLAEGGPDTDDNVVWLCPTSHANVHELLRAWLRYEGRPPWAIRKRFSAYIRGLAESGFEQTMAARER